MANKGAERERGKTEMTDKRNTQVGLSGFVELWRRPSGQPVASGVCPEHLYTADWRFGLTWGTNPGQRGTFWSRCFVEGVINC